MNTDGSTYIDWLDKEAGGLSVIVQAEHFLKIKWREGGEAEWDWERTKRTRIRAHKGLIRELRKVTLIESKILPDGTIIYRFTSPPPKRKRRKRPC